MTIYRHDNSFAFQENFNHLNFLNKDTTAIFIYHSAVNNSSYILLDPNETRGSGWLYKVRNRGSELGKGGEERSGG